MLVLTSVGVTALNIPKAVQSQTEGPWFQIGCLFVARCNGNEARWKVIVFVRAAQTLFIRISRQGLLDSAMESDIGGR